MTNRLLAAAVITITILLTCRAAAGGFFNYSNLAGAEASDVLTLNVTQPSDESIVRSNPVTITGNVRPRAEVTINGLSITVESGHFSTRIDLEPGLNLIDVSAADKSGNQASKFLTVVYVP